MEEEKGRLDDLEQSLYRRGEDVKERPWSRFTKKESSVPRDWKHDHTHGDDAVGAVQPRQSRRSLSVRFFVFSVIFFLIALGVSAFIINRGSNLVSADNIDLNVSGPVSVAGGEHLELQIDVVNRNNTTLELVDLIVEFPEGAKNPEQAGEDLRRLRETLGDLSPGDGESRTVSALLFGEEDSQKQIKVGIEYRVTGSNAIFFKESVFDVQIGTSPVSILVNMPTEINSGKDIEIVAELISNSRETLRNVAFSVEYPFGFSFDDARPKADVGNNIWLLGDLAPQERRTINIAGALEGQDNEERTFRFVGGLSTGVDTDAISTVLLETKRSVAIARPFLQAELALGGSFGDTHIAKAGETVFSTISWQNNLPITVEDARIEVVLTGDILNESSVVASGGFYRSIDNTILWDKSRYAQFARLEPGTRGQVTFEFRSLDPAQSLFEQGTISVSLRISGKRVGDTPQTTGEISSSVAKTVRFASGVDFGARAVYSVGPFTNTGPIPPKAEQSTTYTVIWSVTNTSNDIQSTQVSASLPDYMEWVGTVSPSGESVTFNSVGSEIVWNAGLVSAGTGYNKPPKEVAFQVRLIPSISQVGTTPVIISSGTLTAQDSFTGTTHRLVSGDITTAIASDPQYNFRDGEVTGG